jgi:hypothetical protein
MSREIIDRLPKREEKIPIRLLPYSEDWRIARNIFMIELGLSGGVNDLANSQRIVDDVKPVSAQLGSSEDVGSEFEIAVRQEPLLRYILVLLGMEKPLRSYVIAELLKMTDVEILGPEGLEKD